MSAFGIDIDPKAVCIYREPPTKHEALDTLVQAIGGTDVIDSLPDFQKAVYEREAVMSTGIGSGVAIPHVRSTAVRRPAVAVGLCPDGIDFDTLDNQPVSIIVLFAMPAGSQKDYLGLLAQVMLAMKMDGFREKLMQCNTSQEVADLINNMDI